MIISPYHGSDGFIKKNESSRTELSDVISVLEASNSQISSAKTKDVFELNLMN